MPLIDASQTYQMTNVGDHINATDVYNTNPNLIMNPFFTVNQRGVSGAVAGGQYGPDRWSLNASSSVSANMGTGYITLPSGGYEVIQTIEDLSSTYGKQVTYSVLDDTGEIRSATITMPTTPAVQNYINTTINGVRLRLRYLNPNWRVFMDAQDGAAHTIKAAKLEIGSVSTLANDAAPDYGTELAKCQRYFVRFDFNTAYRPAWAGVVTSASQMLATVILPVPMNPIYPTVTLSGTLQFVEFTSSGGVLRTASSIAGNVPIGNTMRLNVNTSGSLTVYNSTIVYTASNTCVIDISCEL